MGKSNVADAVLITKLRWVNVCFLLQLKFSFNLVILAFILVIKEQC